MTVSIEELAEKGQLGAFKGTSRGPRMPTVDTSFSRRMDFDAISRLILNDPNVRRGSPNMLRKYDKEQIAAFLGDPYRNQMELRDATLYIYNSSTHFRRLIQYFEGLTDLAYVLAPYRIDTLSTKPNKVSKAYRTTLNALSSFDIRNQFPKIVRVCLREDTFFGYIREGADSTIVQQLPFERCRISAIEDNVPNVTFDFSYFDGQGGYLLSYYPAEFAERYEAYKLDKQGMRWQELSAPNAFAVKCNSDIPLYSIPPFVGILREIYSIEDYKDLKLAKTELENYAILSMKIAMDTEGNFLRPLEESREIWQNLDRVLPEQVGSVLTDMDMEKFSFDNSNAGDADTIAEAEQNLFTAAGVSSLLFNNTKASSNALLLSIKADQALTYGIVRGIEGVLNRYIHSQKSGRNWKVTFLDVSPFNRKEIGDQYLKAATYGMPTITYFCASQGLLQEDMDGMNYLEDEVLKLKERFDPLRSSSTQSADSADGEGRPESDTGDLTDSGEQSRETDDGDDN